MFKKFFSRNVKTSSTVETEQHKLDCLRHQYADNTLMQLHFDRMQTALDITL